MPNHVTSELIFRGITPEEQNALLKKLCNAEGKVDFDILVPTPLNLWLGNEGADHERAFGKRLGMTWARENWGCIWNAYKTRDVIWADDTLTLVFDTANSPPYPWLAAVFNTTKRSFDHNWLDEGADWAVSGVWDYAQIDGFGQPWKEDRASLETQERLHTLKWGVPSFPDETDDDSPSEASASAPATDELVSNNPKETITQGPEIGLMASSANLGFDGFMAASADALQVGKGGR